MKIPHEQKDGTKLLIEYIPFQYGLFLSHELIKDRTNILKVFLGSFNLLFYRSEFSLDFHLVTLHKTVNLRMQFFIKKELRGS